MSVFNSPAFLRGIPVTLYERTETGKNELNRPVYEEKAVTVDNVLVGRPTEQEITEELNLTGRRAEYVLGIPKGDAHDWTDKKVGFFGQIFRTIGAPAEGIESMVPMTWNKKVRCERINGED